MAEPFYLYIRRHISQVHCEARPGRKVAKGQYPPPHIFVSMIHYISSEEIPLGRFPKILGKISQTKKIASVFGK